MNFMDSTSSIWHQDSAGDIWRQKGNEKVCYKFDQVVGFGTQGKIWTIIRESGNGKTKIAKVSSTLLKNEYEASLKYPKNALGLVLRAKAYISGTHQIIIMHKYDGDLASLISTMTNNQKIEAVYQLCKGILTIHTLNISHRDIHLGNIFYDKIKNRYDLGDFGYSTESKEEKFKLNDITLLKKTIESILIGKEPDPVFVPVNFTKNTSSSNNNDNQDEILGLLEEIFSKNVLTVPSSDYVQRLKTKEDVMLLGYSDEVADLIMNFMNHTPDNIQMICATFKNVMKLMKHQK